MLVYCLLYCCVNLRSLFRFFLRYYVIITVSKPHQDQSVHYCNYFAYVTDVYA
jgi:hypothetical protein